MCFFFSDRYTDSVTVLTTLKERTASVARWIIMTDRGDLLLLKTQMNAEVCIFFLINCFLIQDIEQ